VQNENTKPAEIQRGLPLAKMVQRRCSRSRSIRCLGMRQTDVFYARDRMRIVQRGAWWRIVRYRELFRWAVSMNRVAKRVIPVMGQTGKLAAVKLRFRGRNALLYPHSLSRYAAPCATTKGISVGWDGGHCFLTHIESMSWPKTHWVRQSPSNYLDMCTIDIYHDPRLTSAYFINDN